MGGTVERMALGSKERTLDELLGICFCRKGCEERNWVENGGWLLGIFFSGGALGGAGDWRNRWGRQGVYGIGLQKIF